MDLGLAGSTAVVTGGSKGMGLAIATTLAEEGAKVAVMARGAQALDDAVAKLREAGAPDAVGISVNMADAESITAGFEAVAQRWGELNSLVHTIGPGDGYFEDMDDAQWEDAFTLGTMSGVRSIRAALPMLRAANTGVSAIVGAQGVVQEQTRLFEPTVLVSDVPARRVGPTPYTRLGDWVVWASWAILGISGGRRLVGRAERPGAGDPR